MLRTTLRPVPFVLAGALLLTGCESVARSVGAAPVETAAGVTEERVVEHAAGTTRISGTPQRVVVLDSGELDAVTSLGVVPVGAIETEGLLEELAEVHGFDASTVANVGAISEPNLEAIAALRPDLILSNTVRDGDRYEQLSAIAPTVMAGDLGAVWKDNFTLDAEALNRSAEAEEILADYRARVDEVAEQWSDPASTEISVLRFMGGGEVRAYGRGSFIGSVLKDVGFVWPAAIDTAENRVELTTETLAQAEADVIFWSPGFGDAGRTEVANVTAGPLWGSLGAVRAGSAYEVSDDTWFLGLGPSGADGVLDDLEDIAARR
ncbi:ABC transporter substrate-binding protein [Kineococcus gynurae]|uniref:ABC transporter substrate-binding protein n=1 Tax=Kineococcus gynurae TaxID=452979 RepID=A0ABV5LSU6_9ACTN